ncbi:putative secretion system X pseudopilin PulG-like [Collimonas arenae]|uniref:Putative secretion system X pseudopilin PulG-like n=1 Tax=Collimonas arenae TaxID=279058 RepID=A0A0A1F9I7_9BURK|nr:putative secretion system X pseudopilin PulG-like [Collimonas arenae]
MLAVVALMGLSLTLGADIYTTSVTRDKEAELLAIGRQFRIAIGRYYESQAGGASASVGSLGNAGQTNPAGAVQAASGRVYPASLEDLLKDNRSPGLRRHLRKIFIDPMTGGTEWGLVRVGGRIVGVHSTSVLMPIKQDRFEADDMTFRGKEKYSDWVFTYPADLLLRGDLEGAGGGKELKAVSLDQPIGAPVLPAAVPNQAPINSNQYQMERK